MGLSELMMVIGWRFKCRHQELKKEGLESEGNISRVQWFKNGPVQISTLHCCPRLAYAPFSAHGSRRGGFACRTSQGEFLLFSPFGSALPSSVQAENIVFLHSRTLMSTFLVLEDLPGPRDEK